VQILEKAEKDDKSAENEANWKSLGKVALDQKNLQVAERCFAAIGDVAKVKWIKQVKKLGQSFKRDTGKDPQESPVVLGKLAMLEKKFHKAEAILLQANEVDLVMEM